MAIASGRMSGGLLALPGVFRAQADARFLVEALSYEDLGTGTDALEIGTGTGALALHAAGRGARVTAVDVSRPAVVTARLNDLRRRLPLRVLHGDLAARTVGRRFGLYRAVRRAPIG
ncbi:methyltransferase domain-containing protein [Streptomyces sp. NBC_00354]|uniref:methyltransferase domain-containing protein n=1 Tax=Streptomyces sp. NBC_00354 TaxID=2975723 RepID=UPI002E26C04F